jgi:YD repeat-containing protein
MRGVARLEQRPSAITISRTVDSDGNITAQTDGASNNYTYLYDGARRMTRKTPPIGAATNISWTASVNRDAARGALVESAAFDGMGNPYLVTRGGIPTLSAVDAFSRKNFESLSGAVTQNGPDQFAASGTSAYRDLIGRVTRVTNPDTTGRTLSHVGNSTTERDERNYNTVYRYWALGDPDKRFLYEIAQPDGSVLTIGRDDLGNITSVAQGTVTRTYGYNGSYFLTSMTDPETGTTTFGRDSVGNMTSRTVGGRTTNFSYDGVNRLIGVEYPGGAAVTIAYLGNGRTSSVTNSKATRSYFYDANANLTSETLVVGAQTFTTTYTYNGNDALATIAYPRTSEVVTRGPDALGRPTAASPYVTAVSYLASGNPQKISYANGTELLMDETSRQWPMNMTAQKPNQPSLALVKKHYDYDPSGNILQIIEGEPGSPREVLGMTYDSINQLKSTQGPWGLANFNYDPVGNITANGGLASSYVYGSNNKLNSVNSAAVTYDVYGNVTTLGAHTYTYDDASNLVCVDCGTANEIAYAYDGNNRRVSRTKGTEITYYVQAANGDLILEYTTPPNVAIQHVYLHGKRIASKRVQL